MLEYEISQIIHTILPYLTNTLSIVSGVIISNIFWKARIHRYAKTEVVETLEYQKNKITHLESDIKTKDDLISDLKGSLKIAKTSALEIIGVSK